MTQKEEREKNGIKKIILTKSMGFEPTRLELGPRTLC